MKISLHIHERYKEPEIAICGPENNEKLKEVYRIVSDAVNEQFTLYDEGEAVNVSCVSIIRFYADGQKVKADTLKGTYTVKKRLYELETLLDEKSFVRISNSEIVNVKKIRRLDTSMAGTIHIYLDGEIETYVSRRYVRQIKQALGMGKEARR